MASEKSVKVYARVRDPKTGEESLTVVGRSHPGEVRMLRKNGLAEWVDGKIILNLTPAPVEAPRKKWVGVDAYIHRLVSEGSLFKNPAIGSQGFRPDPNTGEQIYGEPLPEEVICKDAGEWFRQVAEERRAGRTLYVADDPRNLRLGFVSDEVNTVWYLGIRHIKIATPEDTAPMVEFGFTHEQVQEALRTEEGRESLLRVTDKTFSLSGILPETPTYEGSVDTVRVLQDFLGSEAQVRSDAEVEELTDTPFWSIVVEGLAGRFVEAPDEGDASNFSRGGVHTPTEKGWAKFEYPRDRDRIPLMTPDGSDYVAVFQGTFRRRGRNLEVRTEDGREFTAVMSNWTLAEEITQGKKPGYIVPE